MEAVVTWLEIGLLPEDFLGGTYENYKNSQSGYSWVSGEILRENLKTEVKKVTDLASLVLVLFSWGGVTEPI